MRAWLDTGAKRRWAATPSPSLVGDSVAASRIAAFDMDQGDDGNRSVNLSGNPKDGRTDQVAGERDGRRDGGKVGMRAPGSQIMGRD